MTSPMAFFQPLGRALMLPIAVLPIAGLLLRIGQPDLLDIAFIGAAGEAIFSNLGLLFAIGVAAGFARDGNGAACLAGVVCFLVAGKGAGVLIAVPPDTVAGLTGAAAGLAAAAFRTATIAKIEVPIGILSGLVGGLFYNRYSTMKLPEYLAFFGGRRFVPIVSGPANLREVGACTTRLRLGVADQALVDEPALKALGARGVLRPGGAAVQVVLGPIADGVAMEMRAALDRPAVASAPASVAEDAYVVPAALGGSANVAAASRHFGRVRVEFIDPELVEHAVLTGRGVRAIA